MKLVVAIDTDCTSVAALRMSEERLESTIGLTFFGLT